MVTAAVDGLDFLNPIKVGDFIVLTARVTCAFMTSLEVEVVVQAEEALTGRRQITSRAYLTFVTLAKDGVRAKVPPLEAQNEEDRQLQAAAGERRTQNLKRRDRAHT
jgi:acyl-CoA hydrolase